MKPFHLDTALDSSINNEDREKIMVRNSFDKMHTVPQIWAEQRICYIMNRLLDSGQTYWFVPLTTSLTRLKDYISESVRMRFYCSFTRIRTLKLALSTASKLSKMKSPMARGASYDDFIFYIYFKTIKRIHLTKVLAQSQYRKIPFASAFGIEKRQDVLIYLYIIIFSQYLMQSGRTVHKQLIDQNRQFHRESIETATKIVGPVGREYRSVAIIGVQNSGKSTLLNFLFGTNFSVLHEMAGTRTTRGIWVSVDKKENILVFDVQGNDSMDRAEEQDYEKMVATYALVTANVLLINVWSKTVGQYNGTQYETLKVIMDICITQFKHQSPKTILFCVRDFNQQFDNEGETRRKIIKDVNDIWRKIQKPAELQAYNQKPEKFFTIQVSVLRRYKQGRTEKFIEDIGKLREKFVNPKFDGYVFAKQKTQFNLPISDFSQLSENAWENIKTNKKLNLPNEKDQLASFRCSSIMGELEQKFLTEVAGLKESNLVADLGKLKDKYITLYQQQTYHYNKAIADQKSKELEQGMSDSLKKFATEKLDSRVNEIVKQFQDESANFSQENDTSLDTQMNRIFQAKIEELINFMRHLNFQISDRKQRIENLTKVLKGKMKQLRENYVKASVDIFQNESSRSIRLLTSQLIKQNFGANFWIVAKAAIEEKGKQLIENYRKTYTWATGQELDAVQYGNMEEKIREQSKQFIKSELQKNFQAKILEDFKSQYNKDENGNSINFNLKTEQQISQHFDRTRDAVMETIRRINEYNVVPRRSSIIETAEEDSLFESTWLSNTTEQIDKQMIGEFEKTIRRKKQGEMNQVPWWMFILILYFVYDDIWFSEEESPVIHYFLVVVILIVTALLAIGQGKLIQESIRIVTDKLKQKIPFLR